jgi:toxin-antitoxin system PIN domain toxin
MILPDVNILVYAFREQAPDHERYLTWLQSIVDGDEAYGMSPQVLSSFIRIVTNRRIFAMTDTAENAIAFANGFLEQPHCQVVQPGARHWGIFCDLCLSAKATGDLVADAWLAALAIEHGCEWITTDRDFARFPGLRWRTPF